MAIRFIHNPLPARAAACGRVKDHTVAKSWQAKAGAGPNSAAAKHAAGGDPARCDKPTAAGESAGGPSANAAGLCLVDDAPAALDKAPWTLEMWVAWPEGSDPLRRPAVLAECAGENYSWILEFDFSAALKFTWRCGDYMRVVVSSYLIDAVQPGKWYHVAVAVGRSNATLYLTEAGTPVAQDSNGPQKLDPKGLGKGGPARLAIGRRVEARVAGILPARGEGVPPLRPEGILPARGEGVPPARGEGVPPARGEGVPPLRPEGVPPSASSVTSSSSSSSSAAAFPSSSSSAAAGCHGCAVQQPCDPHSASDTAANGAAVAPSLPSSPRGSSPMRIGSAAVHGRLLTPTEFRSLGGAALPKGVRVDGDFEWGNLGRVFRIARDTIVFTGGEKDGGWWGFRVRGAKGKRLAFWHFGGNAYGISAFVSEDGGATWRPPNGATVRSSEGALELRFAHTFETEEAIFVASPPVTNEIADAWFDATAERLKARVHVIGQSREGRPLRVMEVGNPDAPLVHLQAGQHAMQERQGFYMIAPAFEAAAADAELMAKTRWTILPVVNVDSWTVTEIDGNMNRFWLSDKGPPTVMALVKFLKAETDRTGGIVMADWHGGGCWRGHTMLNAFPKEYGEPGGPAAPAPGAPPLDMPEWFSDPETNWNSLHTKRESALPEFEACMREEGLYYLALNGYERNRATYGKIGYFEDCVMHFRGVKLPLCIELSSIVAETPDGAEPVSLKNLREDGVRWYRAIKRYVNRHL